MNSDLGRVAGGGGGGGRKGGGGGGGQGWGMEGDMEGWGRFSIGSRLLLRLVTACYALVLFGTSPLCTRVRERLSWARATIVRIRERRTSSRVVNVVAERRTFVSQAAFCAPDQSPWRAHSVGRSQAVEAATAAGAGVLLGGRVAARLRRVHHGHAAVVGSSARSRYVLELFCPLPTANPTPRPTPTPRLRRRALRDVLGEHRDVWTGVPHAGRGLLAQRALRAFGTTRDGFAHPDRRLRAGAHAT
jgi:hypothetical protein